MKRSIALLLSAACVAAFAASPARAAGLDSLVSAHTYAIAFDGTTLSGPGADWLIEEGAKAHFFMLGEQHATADIAHFATAMWHALGAHGYRHAAVEVGPWSTGQLEVLLRQGPDALERWTRAEPGRGFTFPFFFFTEEAAFGYAVVEQAGRTRNALWGLDQEFIAAGDLLLGMLAAWADTPEAKAAVAEAAANAKANPMFLGRGDEVDWKQLTDAFATSRSPDAKRLLDEIAMSRRIYAPFTGRGGSVYLANEERERYMKDNFLQQFARAENAEDAPPRVFLKFGANHVAYGHSPTHVLTLGTFVHEYGQSRGLGTFNVHVDCHGGEGRDPRSGEASACESYFLGPDSALRKFLRDDAVTLIDLRALRANGRIWKDLDDKSRDLILSYDAYVALPNVKPATSIAP